MSISIGLVERIEKREPQREGAQCFHDRDGSGRGPLMATLLGYAAAQQWLPATAAPAGAVAD